MRSNGRFPAESVLRFETLQSASNAVPELVRGCPCSRSSTMACTFVGGASFCAVVVKLAAPRYYRCAFFLWPNKFPSTRPARGEILFGVLNYPCPVSPRAVLLYREFSDSLHNVPMRANKMLPIWWLRTCPLGSLGCLALVVPATHSSGPVAWAPRPFYRTPAFSFVPGGVLCCLCYE